MTSKIAYKRGFGPFAPEVYRAPVSVDAVRTLLRSEVDPDSVACVVVEPVQGEGGFWPLPGEFPAQLKALCAAHGILYVDDEVQAGVGRTGPVWAIEHYGVEPDLLVSGKSLGGGLPLAAVTGRAALMDAVHPGGLGGTFGGNPVACAAACVVLDTVADPAFRERSEQLGARLRSRLEAIAPEQVRGLGPMLAVEVASAEIAAAVVSASRARGLLLLTCGLDGNVIRLLPPLTISDEDAELGLDILESALREAAH